MASVQIELVSPAVLAADEECVRLMATAQAVAGARCLHADFEIDANVVAREDAQVMRYVVARAAEDEGASRPLAIIGIEVADDLQRAWLRGPFVASASVAAHEVPRLDDAGFAAATMAFTALRDHVGARAHTWDAFIEPTHSRAMDWYAQHGFARVRKHSNYIVRRDAARYNAVVAAVPPEAAMIDAIVALAEEAFPGGYLTREDFAAPASDEAITLVMRDGDSLLGYIRASYEPGAIEVFIDNLAVCAQVRRRGVGRQLLNAALHWAFDVRAAPQVALTVKEGNTNAERLYQSAGFHLLAEGQHLRLAAPSATA